jgi:hypothetical protein
MKPTKSILKLQAITVACALIGTAVPRASATEHDAIENAARIAAVLVASGDWDLQGFGTGFLREGTSTIRKTTLHGGVTYKIIAAGCDDATDVDVKVYDANWNLVDEDNDSSQIAVADVAPRWTGTFYVKVIMHSCAYGERSAHWSVQLASED